MQAVRFRAPGRVNLLGEHTDYAGGLCLPVAIHRFVIVEASRRQAGILIQSPFGTLEAPRVGPVRERWAAFVMGCAQALGISGGFELRVSSDLPVGQGLGSSGAYTVAVTAALARLFDLHPDLVATARAGENFTGVRCGIMDQTVSAHARKGQALLIDAASGTHELIPFPGRIAILQTPTNHDLAASGYNQRVQEWQEARALLSNLNNEIAALPEPLRSRALHIQQEISRVRAGARLLREGDLEGFGRLMWESHESLSNLYEVSTPELDAAVARAREAGALGAKLTGAGFGGAVVCLLRPGERLRLPDALTLETADGVSPY